MGKTNGKKLMTVHKHPSVIKKNVSHKKSSTDLERKKKR